MYVINKESTRHNVYRNIFDNDKFIHAAKHKPENPWLVEIEPTNHCNMRCLMCANPIQDRPRGFMDYQLFLKLLDEIEGKSQCRLIGWGEPLLHKDIFKMVEELGKRCFWTHLTTNGKLLDSTLMKKIVNLQLNSLIFSLQGVTKQQYNTYRIGFDYDKLLEKIIDLSKIRGESDFPYIHLAVTVTDDTKEEIDSFIKLILPYVDSIGIGKTNLELFDTQRIVQKELRKRLQSLKDTETLKRKYVPCKEIHQKISVRWDGTITACCTDYDNTVVLGNIKNDNIIDIWRTSKRLNILRQATDNCMHKSFRRCQYCFHTYDEF